MVVFGLLTIYTTLGLYLYIPFTSLELALASARIIGKSCFHVKLFTCFNTLSRACLLRFCLSFIL